MSALLRPAVVADAASIARLHIESWQSAYRGQLPDRYLDELDHEFSQRTEFWRTHISTPPEKVEIWVAGNEQSVEGFEAFGPARHAEATPVGEIYAIYVHPRFWHQGVGRSLFTHAMARLASFDFSEAILWVLESNARARRFYEIAGWAADGATKAENLPGGIEVREVCYRKTLQRKKEE